MKHKKETLKKLKENLLRLEAEIDVWKAKAKSVTLSARSEYTKQIENLNSKKEALIKQIQDLRNNPGDTVTNTGSSKQNNPAKRSRSVENTAKQF